jgi:hypothetical protein
LTDVSEVFTDFIISAIIALMVEAVSTSETSVSVYEAKRRNILEDSHVYTLCLENLISQTVTRI